MQPNALLGTRMAQGTARFMSALLVAPQPIRNEFIEKSHQDLDAIQRIQTCNILEFNVACANSSKVYDQIANQKIQTCKVLEFTNSQTMHAQVIKGPVTRMLYQPVKTSDHFCSAHMFNQELVPVDKITGAYLNEL